MGKCFDVDCRHRSERDSCRFLRFPKSPSKRRKWVRALGRKDGKEPCNSAYLCSCHFPSGSRDKTPTFKKTLLKSPKKMKDESSGPCRKLALVDSPARVQQELPQLVETDVPCAAMSTSPWKVTGCQNINLVNESSPPRPDNELEASDDLCGVTLLCTPSILVEHQSLIEEYQHLNTARELDKENLKCALQQADNLQNQVTFLKEQKQIADKDFAYCALEKIDSSVKCKELEVKLHKCEEKRNNLEMQKQRLSQELRRVQCFANNIENISVQDKHHIETLKDQNKKLESELIRVNDLFSKLQKEVALMTKVIDVLKNEKKMLKEKIQSIPFSIRFSSFCNELNVSHYTGFPNVNTFYWLLNMVPQDLNYYLKSKVECLSREDQLFLALFKLRQNPTHDMLKDLFNVSRFTVSNVFITWVSALHTVLVKGLMKSVPSLKKVQKSMPEAFANYPNCRMIIDCTEVEIEIPGLMKKHNMVYSNYKKRCTFKGLVGCAPNGSMVYVSKLFPGSTHDKIITEECGVLSVFEAGDAIMADKGFLIKDILPNGVTLNLPPFKETPQFTQSQIMETLTIARSRIHVERAIQRVKTYKVLDYIPHSLFPFASEIFQVCGALVNFQKPLIKEVEEIMRTGC